MRKLKTLYYICKKSHSNFLIVLINSLYYQAKGKNIIAHQNAVIKGVKNILIKDVLRIGVEEVGFIHNKDVTWLNIRGKLEVAGSASVGRGCRFDIGKDAVAKLGDGTYIHPFTTVIIMHGMDIGKNCAISWNCQFLDEDFHQIKYDSKKEVNLNAISIGDKVWIGARVSIYKGTVIPKGCVIASNSVVKGRFDEENVLIAGSPAKIVRRNISW